MTEQATTPAILPPAVSADGKRNAFYADCISLKVKKPYAMCQYIIDHKADASMQTLYGDCLTEIRQGRCAAVDMRQKEQLEGRAIYFVERVRGEAIAAHQQQAWVSPLSTKRPRGQRIAPIAPAPVTKPVDILSQPAFGVDIHAAALNKMMEKRVQPAAVAHVISTNATNGRVSPTHTPAAVAAAETPAIKSGALPQIQIRAGESPLEAIKRMKREQAAQQA
ncbi:TPA: hypothetical protein QDB10_002225 [Burkholderia vietnamiensis]|nr:hypothetical protein [Burkholderia vietnamiensis]